ncbi:hypothetical protein RIF29_17155 [Crotalaria pallida]|uniref:Uncharacterized protein n=1 Tax=Crotalaria pallida TaxID=3830 RepID=A0AAN9IF26_CROPI
MGRHGRTFLDLRSGFLRYSLKEHRGCSDSSISTQVFVRVDVLQLWIWEHLCLLVQHSTFCLLLRELRNPALSFENVLSSGGKRVNPPEETDENGKSLDLLENLDYVNGGGFGDGRCRGSIG